MSDDLNLQSLGDDYVLGVLCKKTGLVPYAEAVLGVNDGGERWRLFRLGTIDAKKVRLDDIGRELALAHDSSPTLFQSTVEVAHGAKRLAKVVRAIERWRRNGDAMPYSRRREIVKRMLMEVGNERQFHLHKSRRDEADIANAGTPHTDTPVQAGAGALAGGSV